MTNSENILPTPERMNKGDMKPYKDTGRSECPMIHDGLLKKGLITHDQWKVCNRFRQAWDAFKRPLDVTAMRYGEVNDKIDQDQFKANHLTLADQYVTIMQDMNVDWSRALSLVINDEQTMGNAARSMGVRYDKFKDWFYRGLDYLEDYYG